jgi:Fic family protein
MPGEFRTSQNWIGGPNINTATFVPPIHDSIQELMADIEKLAHEENNILPDLLKIALIHYQFETIHPFLDGNGRIGRLMITLYLVDKGILKKPILYLSDFLEKNRTHYYDNLTRVREKNDLLHWFKFFLTGIIETANKSISTFDAIMQLEKQVNEKLKTLGKRNEKAQLVMNYLYQKPVLNAQVVQKIIGSKNATAYSLIEDLVRLEIVKEITGFQRNRTYIFDEYIKLFK